MTLNQGWTYTDRVPPAAVGQTALDYYTTRYAHSTRAEWRDRLEAGQIQHQGEAIAPNTPLVSGWELQYHRLPWHEPDVPRSIEVLYDDADVLAVAKPSGLPVLPGGGFVSYTVLHQLRSRYPKTPPFPVHRLGRGTSGVLLLARSPQARASLSQQFREQQVKKVYRALVGRSDINFPTEITTPIGKLPHPRLGYIYGATPTGQTAWSRATVVERRADSTLLDVEIRTGRPHQIRIHLAAIGLPLLGDPLYTVGGVPNPEKPNATPGDCGYWLHAHRVQFEQPSTGEMLAIAAEPPLCLQRSTHHVRLNRDR